MSWTHFRGTSAAVADRAAIQLYELSTGNLVGYVVQTSVASLRDDRYPSRVFVYGLTGASLIVDSTVGGWTTRTLGTDDYLAFVEGTPILPGENLAVLVDTSGAAATPVLTTTTVLTTAEYDEAAYRTLDAAGNVQTDGVPRHLSYLLHSPCVISVPLARWPYLMVMCRERSDPRFNPIPGAPAAGVVTVSDIVCFLATSPRFDDAVGPFWLVDSLAAVPSNVGTDAVDPILHQRRRHWCSVPGVAVAPDHSNDLLLYYVAEASTLDSATVPNLGDDPTWTAAHLATRGIAVKRIPLAEINRLARYALSDPLQWEANPRRSLAGGTLLGLVRPWIAGEATTRGGEVTAFTSLYPEAHIADPVPVTHNEAADGPPRRGDAAMSLFFAMKPATTGGSTSGCGMWRGSFIGNHAPLVDTAGAFTTTYAVFGLDVLLRPATLQSVSLGKTGPRTLQVSNPDLIVASTSSYLVYDPNPVRMARGSWRVDGGFDDIVDPVVQIYSLELFTCRAEDMADWTQMWVVESPLASFFDLLPVRIEPAAIVAPPSWRARQPGWGADFPDWAQPLYAQVRSAREPATPVPPATILPPLWIDRKTGLERMPGLSPA